MRLGARAAAMPARAATPRRAWAVQYGSKLVDPLSYGSVFVDGR